MVKYDKNKNWEDYDQFKKDELLKFIKKAKEILNSMPSAYHKEKGINSGHAIRHMTLLLILKQLLNESYRGLMGFVENSEEVQEAIGMKKVPHYAYLQQVSKKIDEEFFEEFFKEFREEHDELELATDATGFSSGHSSSYYTTKIKGETKISDFIKLHALEDVDTQLIVYAEVTKGLRHESPVFGQMLDKLPEELDVAYVLADKAYDAEKHHKVIQTKFDADSVIDIRGKDRINSRSGRYRKKSFKKFREGEYEEKRGQRSLIESTFSVIKRVLGGGLKAKKFVTQRVELILRVIAYNIRRLVLLERLGKI